MKVTHAQLEEATQYVSFNIKEGYFSEEDWKDLSDEEFVKKAEYERGRADAYENINPEEYL